MEAMERLTINEILEYGTCLRAAGKYNATQGLRFIVSEDERIFLSLQLVRQHGVIAKMAEMEINGRGLRITSFELLKLKFELISYVPVSSIHARKRYLEEAQIEKETT
jgi:hypothetical protein